MENDGVDTIDDIQNTLCALRIYLEIIKNTAIYLVEQKYGKTTKITSKKIVFLI